MLKFLKHFFVKAILHITPIAFSFYDYCQYLFDKKLNIYLNTKQGTDISECITLRT
jgi:hypothetical protein